MARDWEKFEDDELMTIWSGYKAHEFGTDNVLNMRRHHQKPIRLTSIEIIALVDELMTRLEIKRNVDDS